jgi:hypothetical protein
VRTAIEDDLAVMAVEYRSALVRELVAPKAHARRRGAAIGQPFAR